MPIVKIKGVGDSQFPDDMSNDSIRDFLRAKYIDRLMAPPTAPQPRLQTIEPTTPTLAERGGQFVSDTLTDTGIISDPYRAQRIGSNISALGEFLPGLGDATAGDEFGRALREGDIGGALLSGASAVPFAGDAAIFAGALAKNADLGALKRAVSLEGMGKNRDEVWKETGWFNDKGDWKFEIDDSGVTYDNPFSQAEMKDFPLYSKYSKAIKENRDEVRELKEAGTYNIQDFWDNKPEGAYDEHQKARKFVRAYEANAQPQIAKRGQFDEYVKGSEGADAYDLGEIPLRLDPKGSGGSFQRFDNISGYPGLIQVNDAGYGKGAKSTAMHEMQHAIQGREGFARGGSPQQFERELSSLDRDIKGFGKVLDNRLSTLRADGEYKQLQVDLMKAAESRDMDKLTEISNKQNDYLNNDPIVKQYKADLHDMYGKRGDTRHSPMDKYWRLGGEAESRNVQTRLDWTPEQRRATPPWQSLDVPEDELIYRKK